MTFKHIKALDKLTGKIYPVTGMDNSFVHVIKTEIKQNGQVVDTVEDDLPRDTVEILTPVGVYDDAGTELMENDTVAYYGRGTGRIVPGKWCIETEDGCTYPLKDIESKELHLLERK